ncbi:MAG: DUF4199 domain-containing protein [Bacteroidota bacterium]|nr:DUF4199 domain-containing protein [Bacteroidota bacterium]
MTERKTSMAKSALNYSLVTGAVIIIFSLLLYVLNINVYENDILGYVSYAILIIGMIIGSKSFRDNELDGFASYGQAYGSGILIVFFTAVLVSVYTYLFYGFIYPEGLDEMLRVSEEKMYQKGLEGEQLDAALAITKKFMNPVLLSVSVFFGYLVWGAIISVVISFFIKKEPK